ncbi:hypothetical protein ACWEO2_27535 [Nocardia sp. NPDC004278]
MTTATDAPTDPAERGYQTIAELDLDPVVASGTGTIPVDVRIVIAPEE